MFRLKKTGRFIGSTVSVILAVLLFSINIAGAGLSHAKVAQEKGIQQGCSNVCVSHAQAAVVGDSTNKKEKEDKEPTPPSFTWVDSPYSLLALYVVPFVFLIVFIDRHRQSLLTTHLRF